MTEYLKEVPKEVPKEIPSEGQNAPSEPEKIMYLYKEKTEEGMVFVAKIQLDGKDTVRIEAPVINLTMDINIMVLSHLTARLHQFQKSVEEVEKLKESLQILQDAVIKEQTDKIISKEQGGEGDDEKPRDPS